MFAYCLFCETQRCKAIADIISKNYGYICISPQIIQRKWIKGNPTEEAHDWLPGYIFLYSEIPILPHFEVEGIIRILGNSALTGSDQRFAELILCHNGVIGNVTLIQNNGRCILSDPAWNSFNATIIKLDRERKRCCVQFEFDDAIRTIWIGYEISSND